jgi:hypothetical protein
MGWVARVFDPMKPTKAFLLFIRLCPSQEAEPNYWPKRKAAILKPIINKIGGWLILCEKKEAK